MQITLCSPCMSCPLYAQKLYLFVHTRKRTIPHTRNYCGFSFHTDSFNSPPFKSSKNSVKNLGNSTSVYPFSIEYLQLNDKLIFWPHYVVGQCVYGQVEKIILLGDGS